MLPFPILNQYGNIVPPPTTKIKSLKSSPSANSVLLEYTNGELYALGTNTNGKFGTGNTTNLTVWTKITNTVKTYYVTAGSCFYVTTDNKVYACGSLSLYNGANLNGSSTGWGVTTPVSIFQDMTYTYPPLMLSNGIKQIEGSDSTLRQWVVDSTGILWGLGSQSSYTLGTAVGSPNTDWVQITTNVDKVFSTQQSVWIIKNDKTVWRSGINTGGQIAGTSSSDSIQGFTELNIYSPLTYVDINTIGNNIQLLLSDGTMRFYGTQSWVNSSAVQLQPGYIPSVNNNSTPLSGVLKMNNSSGQNPNYFALTSNNLWAEGANSSGSLGIGNTANAYSGIWSSALTGVLVHPSTTPNLSSITNMSSVSTAGFITTEDEVYVSGANTYTMNNATNGYWQVQRTPKSSIWANVDNNPALIGTTTNFSSVSPNLTRYNHATAKWGTKLILFGGLTGSTVFADQEINIYDTVTGLWSSISNTLGISRMGHGIEVVGNKLYIGGGYSTAGATPAMSATLYSVDLNTGTWSTLSPPAQGGFVKMSATLDGKIWYWGGGSSTTGALQCYDTITSTWSTHATSPIPAANTGDLTTDGTYLYGSALTAGFIMYNPTTHSWITLQNRPDSLAGKHAYNNGIVYAIIRGILYGYRISTGVWQTMTTVLPSTTTASFCTTFITDGIFFSGGSNASSTTNFYKIQ